MTEINSTLAIRKHFGLIKDGQTIYRNSININQDDMEDDDEIIDTNQNNQVEDEEAWAFLARHSSLPNIKEFIDGELTEIILRDFEDLPMDEKIALLNILEKQAKGPKNINLFNARIAKVMHSNIGKYDSAAVISPSLSIYTYLLVYNPSLIEDLGPLAPFGPIKEAPIRLNTTRREIRSAYVEVLPLSDDSEPNNENTFFSALGKALSLEFSGHLFLPTVGESEKGEEEEHDVHMSLENLPCSTKQEGNCKYFSHSVDTNFWFVMFESKIFIYQIFGVGAGFSWGIIDANWGENESAYIDAKAQPVMPLFELRLPLVHLKEEDYSIDFGPFFTYAPFFGKNNLMVNCSDGQDNTLATINSSSYGFGLYARGGALVWKFLTFNYVDLDIKKAKIPGADNNSNVSINYDPWVFNVAIFSWGLNINDELIKAPW